MKGRVAVLPAYGGKFELREYPAPDIRAARTCRHTLGAPQPDPSLKPPDVRRGRDHTACARCVGSGLGETARAPGSPAPAGAIEEKAYLVVVVALRNTRGKPGVGGSRCTADEEHGASAGCRWRRRQDIVDVEVSVGSERDT